LIDISASPKEARHEAPSHIPYARRNSDTFIQSPKKRADRLHILCQSQHIGIDVLELAEKVSVRNSGKVSDFVFTPSDSASIEHIAVRDRIRE
jgi:hypothetical protein